MAATRAHVLGGSSFLRGTNVMPRATRDVVNRPLAQVMVCTVHNGKGRRRCLRRPPIYDHNELRSNRT